MGKHKKHIISILFFIVFNIIYFGPLFSPDQKVLYQSDKVNYKGMSKEIFDHRNSYNEDPLWTNSMFSGMPAYQIAVQWKGNLLKYFDKLFKGFLPKPAGFVFLYMLGFYFLLISLSIDYRLSIMGALAFAMSSYFFIILEAGHNTKAHAIGYMAPILASVLMTYRNKLLLGGTLTALFVSLILYANHLQITYYLIMILIVIGFVFLFNSIKNKNCTLFIKQVFVLLFAAFLGFLTNVDRISSTYEYGEYTIRGSSDLSTQKENRTSGLDKDYATQWSYGVKESFNLIIPNLFGGSSSESFLADNESNTMKFFRTKVRSQQDAMQLQNFTSTYWGDQPFTSGPVYIGSVVFFLFVISLFVLKGNFKTWILISIILSVMLAWGKNFMFLTDLFLEYFPGYNKFRAVSTILVIAELLIPLLACYCLNVILFTKNNFNFNLIKKSFFISGGICALFFVLPSLLVDFSSLKDNNIPADYLGLISSLELDRIALAKKDAFRSLVFISFCFGLFYLFHKKTIKVNYLIVGIGLLILFDMWSINKRYLDTDDFVDKKKMDRPFQITKADDLILKDKDLHYRVYSTLERLDASARTSYFHKNIGGYHGAKLRRYQELIDYHLSSSQPNMEVLNMLNVKYVINNYNDVPLLNDRHLGNAWFVNDFKVAQNADDEINLLKSIKTNETVIISAKDEEYLKGFANHIDDVNSDINLVSYKANHLVYDFVSSQNELTVFSEIFYDKGWNVYLNGEKSDYFRVNYVLRGMLIPAGKHKIEFKFEPQKIKNGRKVSYASSSLLFLLLIGVLFKEFQNKN